MSNHKVTFYRCLLMPLKYQEETGHMVSSILFRTEIGGETLEDSAEISQEVGSEFKKAVLKVELPESVKKHFDEHAFAQAVKNYYRDLWASHSGGMRTTMGGPKDYAEDQIIDIKETVEIPAKG